MATLKSFKQVIMEAPDRESLYEVLDTIMECPDKVSVIEFYNRKATSKIVDEISEQLELNLELEHNNHNKTRNNEDTEHNDPIMGKRAQGQT